MPNKHNTRKKARRPWIRELVKQARREGDFRPKSDIVDDEILRVKAIARAFREAFRDHERAEAVSRGDYTLAKIW